MVTILTNVCGNRDAHGIIEEWEEDGESATMSHPDDNITFSVLLMGTLLIFISFTYFHMEKYDTILSDQCLGLRLGTV